MMKVVISHESGSFRRFSKVRTKDIVRSVKLVKMTPSPDKGISERSGNLQSERVVKLQL